LPIGRNVAAVGCREARHNVNSSLEKATGVIDGRARKLRDRSRCDRAISPPPARWLAPAKALAVARLAALTAL
jgi:hypothetical protein